MKVLSERKLKKKDGTSSGIFRFLCKSLPDSEYIDAMLDSGYHIEIEYKKGRYTIEICK